MYISNNKINNKKSKKKKRKNKTKKGKINHSWDDGLTGKFKNNFFFLS